MQPADSRPDPDHSKLSDTTISKPLQVLAPRKLARLLYDSNQPFYILDGKDRIRYANKALLEVLKVEETQLIGLECGQTSTHDVDQNRFASLLSIPSSSRLSTVAIIPFEVPSEHGPGWTAKLLISMDSHFGNGSLGCWLLTDSDPIVQQAATQASWLSSHAIQSAITHARQSFPKLDGMYSLIGSSPSTCLARKQAKATIEGSMSFCISGPPGCGKSTVAQSILYLRSKRHHRNMASQPILPLECRLMDRGLLQEMLELAQERVIPSEKSEAPLEMPNLLLKNLDQLPSESHPLLANFIRRNSGLLVAATAITEDLWRLYPSSKDWQAILATIEVMSIRLLPLHRRIEDICPSAIAILDDLQHSLPAGKRKHLSKQSLACLEGYAWPNDLRELIHNLREALAKSTHVSIEPSDFSLALQTFASHVLKPEPIKGILLDEVLENMERQLIQQAMLMHPRNRAEVARHLGISRTRLLRRLNELHLEELPHTSPPSQPSPLKPEPASKTRQEAKESKVVATDKTTPPPIDPPPSTATPRPRFSWNFMRKN